MLGLPGAFRNIGMCLKLLGEFRLERALTASIIRIIKKLPLLPALNF
jgi:hypothetical protein